MRSPSSSPINCTPFTQTTRAEVALPGPLRAIKPGAEADDRFAQLMKSYSGAQAMPPKPEASRPTAPADTAAKPTAPLAVRQPPEGKTELQRQEEKLAQKKITLNNEARPRTPAPGQAQKGTTNSAVKSEHEKRQVATPDSSSTAVSSESTELDSKAKTKSSDLADSAGAADADAAAAATQQTSIETALIDAANPAASSAAAGQSKQGQVAIESGGPSLALQANANTQAGEDQSQAKPGATPVAANPARAALHAQQSAASAALHSKQAAASPTAELTQSVANSFSRELQTAQGHLVNGPSEPKAAGFTLDGLMMSATGAAATARFETRSEAPLASQLSISQPLTEAGFAPEMAARLSVLAADGVQEARLHLNPAEMGPVSVQIIVDGQQAQVSFHVEHEQTRAVLEQSLPDLAAALRNSGLTLSGGGVFQQPGDQNRQSQQGPAADTARASRLDKNLSVGANSQAAPVQSRATRGVVDLYA